MDSSNTTLHPVKQEVSDNQDDYSFPSSSKIDQALAAPATYFHSPKMEYSSHGTIDVEASRRSPAVCDNYNTSTTIQMKVEPQESGTEMLHEPVHYNSTESSVLNDQEFADHGTYLTEAKIEYPIVEDVDLEATKITHVTPCGTEHSAVQIKVEAQDPVSDQEPEMLYNAVVDQYEACLPEKMVKTEHIPISRELQSPTSVETSDGPIVDSHSESRDYSSATQNTRVYADGAVYEIRVVEDACRTEVNGIPAEQPCNSKPATGNELHRQTAQMNVMNSIKTLGENKQYKCDRCDKSFCDKMELKIHKRNHQFTVCPVCKRTMRTDFVKRHIARVHPDDGILPRNRSFPCDECERVFSNDVQLKNHQLSHKKQGCPICGKIVRSDYLKRHMDLNHPKEVNSSDGSTYPCDQCETVLSNRYLLFFHKRTHQTEECPVCKETLRAGYMKIHIDMKHPDHSTLPENPAFKCDQCEKSFGYKAALTLHKRKHRLTECPVCKKTVRADCLKRHMDFNHPNDASLPENATRMEGYTANGGHPLSYDRRTQQTEDCPECKETFRSDYLKIHIAMKHPNDRALPEERPFQCDQCDKSFCYKTQLRLHKRNHRLTECTVCQKSMRLDCLKLHMTRMHPNNVSSGSAKN
ncbi:zinc finger protein 425-like [Anopheles marshallii]|uniref:zinc finger protein 425-like n=1 Tax=Anopheles marshallii TaxID=1521116 RepID=UPI00237AC59D|nr:zinc finger protein 425-like [Anopheles marshallii]